MISVEDREKIRRAYFKENKSQRQIARGLGHSRKTVQQAIESAEPGSHTLRKPRAATVLGPYKARIDELLEDKQQLPRRGRHTAQWVYEDIQAKGYNGPESTVRGYIAQRRREKNKQKVYTPPEFDPGSDARVGRAGVMAIERELIGLVQTRFIPIHPIFRPDHLISELGRRNGITASSDARVLRGPPRRGKPASEEHSSLGRTRT